MKGLRVINVMAVTLDGKVAAHPQETDESRREYGFTNEVDQNHLIRQIKRADAVITGANSLRVTGGVIDVRNDKGEIPIWAILTKSGLSEDLPFWQQDQVERWLVGPHKGRKTPEEARDNLKFYSPDTKNIASFLAQKLRDRGVETVVLLGGSEVNYEFYQEKLVTDLIITLCPFVFASKGAVPLVAPLLDHKVKFALMSSHVDLSHVFLEYSVQEYLNC